MRPINISPDNTVFAIISFEGPDVYSLAGGLGVRVGDLSQTLARMDYNTHLFFIGDSRNRGEEVLENGKLTLHRWCQWLSALYPRGVYQGEQEKLQDFNKSLPEYIVEKLVRPAAAEGKIVVILAEEWQTAEAMCRIGDLARDNGLSDNIIAFWNANNTFGFENIDWEHLSRVSTLTTVSRYMRNLMRGLGLKTLVIPNGILSSLLADVDVRASASLRADLPGDLVLCKIARWDPSKCWESALDATAMLKAGGTAVKLWARGGLEPYGEVVTKKAVDLGLSMREVGTPGTIITDYDEPFAGANADIYNVKCHCPQSFLRVLYNASDAVLANSRHEPFGLVGLEAMAAGGIAFTGGTGEDYAIPFHNSIVLETTDPREMEEYLAFLKDHPETVRRIRKTAKETAREYTWERVIDVLIRKLEYQARLQGLLAVPRVGRPAPETPQVVSPGAETPAGALSRFTGYKGEFSNVYNFVRELKTEQLLRERADKMQQRAEPPLVFHNHDGAIYATMEELMEGLPLMSEETFKFHVDAMHNDFSNWIRDVYGEKKLAGDIGQAKDRAAAAAVLARFWIPMAPRK